MASEGGRQRQHAAEWPPGLIESAPAALETAGRRTARVSKALWPTAARRALVLDRGSLKHSRLAGLSRGWTWLARKMWLKRPATVARKSHTPETPLPTEAPLVRVLETVDLSRTDVEHFFDADAQEEREERETAELSLGWVKDKVHQQHPGS